MRISSLQTRRRRASNSPHRTETEKMARSLRPSAGAVATIAALLLAVQLAGAAPNKLPSGFKLCPRNDQTTIPCLEEAITVAVHQLAPGLPDFGIPKLEPLEIPQLGIGDPNSNAPVNLKINFTDIRIHNLKDLKPSNVKLDTDDFLFSFHIQMDKVFVEANYVMDGRILLIPAKGVGKTTFNINNLPGELVLKGNKYMKKDKEHLKITNFTVVLNQPDKIVMHFENLFNGDKTLGPTTNNLVNENWMEIWSQLKAPLQEILNYSFREYARRIFDKVPMDDIFLPK